MWRGSIVASLRKRPTDVDTGAVPETPTVESAEPEEPPPTPTPELESPRDDASEALKAQIEALRHSEAMQAARERREAWLNSTPGARGNRDALGAFHHAAIDSGLVDCSPAYFSFLEEQLAALKQPAAAATHMVEEMQQRIVQDRAPERPSRIPYSAPVSRDIPDATGSRHGNRKITLTPQEVEMARVSNISVEEYGRQKLKLRTMRETGEYSEEQRR